MRLTELFDIPVSEFEKFLSGYTLDDIKACGRLLRHNKHLAYIFKLHGFPSYRQRSGKVGMKVLKKINKYGISSITLDWPERNNLIVLAFRGSKLLNIVINSDMSVIEIEADKYVYLYSTLDKNKTLADYYCGRV